MEEQYEISFDLGNGIQVINFVATLGLVAGASNEIVHQAFVRRTLNSGYPLLEMLVIKLRIVRTAAGLVMTCLVLQQLLVNELLPRK